MKPFILALSVFLAGCSAQETSKPSNSEENSLEQAAMERGIVTSSEGLELTGRYERISELGSDKFCAVPDGSGQYAIGMLAVFGLDSQCEAQGTARLVGERLEITLHGNSVSNCRIDAIFDGVTVQLPGQLSETCDSYCSPRASFAGVSFKLAETGAVAGTMARGRKFEKLCSEN